MTVNDLLQRGLPASPSSNLSIQVYRDGELAAAGWPSVADTSGLKMHVYQSREFLDVWMNTIAKTRRMECYLIVVGDGSGRNFLYLPLAIETKFNVRLLRFMDAGVADYNAPILAPAYEFRRQDFAALWSEILSLLPRIDAIDLQKIAGDVQGACNPLNYLDCVPYNSSGHSMELAALRREVDARPSVKRLRQNLRRHYRALNRTGAARFVVNPAAAETERVFERLIELKRQKYIRTGHNFLAMPGIFDFYREMTSQPRIEQISHLSALTCDGNVVSAHLGFHSRDRFYYSVPAYDTEFGRFKVGHLLLQHLIDQSFEHGLNTFDIGVGDFSYKEKWATHRLALYVHERAVTAAGALFLRMRRTRNFVGSTALRRWFRAAR